MAALEITMFGTLRVQRPGQPVLQFPTRRARDLFSYLLVNRHTLYSREMLAELFWDGSKESNPRHCLNTALWRLNRVLGEPEPGEHRYLRVDAQHIGFNTASDCRIDTAEFENRCLWAEQVGAAAPAQQAALYHQAILLYQADLLVDCYEEWCLFERERLQLMYLRALEWLVDYHAARQEYAEATDCATRLLGCDPLREDVHRKLMEFHLATSQPAAALRQYQACETAIRRELGAELAPETQALLPQIFRWTSGESRPLESVGAGDPALLVIGRSSTAGPQTLSAAVVRLREAVVEFDRAQAQLREAALLVEGMASRIVDVPATDLRPADIPVLTRDSASLLVSQAARLVAGAGKQLASLS